MHSIFYNIPGEYGFLDLNCLCFRLFEVNELQESLCASNEDLHTEQQAMRTLQTCVKSRENDIKDLTKQLEHKDNQLKKLRYTSMIIRCFDIILNLFFLYHERFVSNCSDDMKSNEMDISDQINILNEKLNDKDCLIEKMEQDMRNRIKNIDNQMKVLQDKLKCAEVSGMRGI